MLQEGIETLLANLSAHLTRRGCLLTHLASGESRVSGELVWVTAQSVISLMQEGHADTYQCTSSSIQLQLAMAHASRAHVIHSHIGAAGFVLSAINGVGRRVLHTLHSPITNDLLWFASRNPQIRFSVVSEFQRARLRSKALNDCTVIPNGVEIEAMGFSEHGAGRLFFMGRIEPDKAPDLAIKAAIALGMPLDLAGPIVDRQYFVDQIEPALGGQVQYLGVLNHERKVQQLQRADCLIMPSQCDEAFGLVAVEAMVCGTPVVATRRGALPEIVEEGVTGFLIESDTDLESATREAIRLPRRKVRERGIARFDIAVVAKQYHEFYQRIVREAERDV